MTSTTLESFPLRLRSVLPSIADFFGRRPSIVPPAMKVVALAVDAAARRIDRDRRGSVMQLDLARPQADLQPTVLSAAEPAAGLLALPMVLNEAATEYVEVAEPEAVIEGVRDFTIEAATQPTLVIVPDATDDADAEPAGRFPHAPLCELGPWYLAPPSPERTLLAIREAELCDAKQQVLAWTRTARALEDQLATERHAHRGTREEFELAMERVGELENVEAETASVQAIRREAASYFEELERMQGELDAALAALNATKAELAERTVAVAEAERRCCRPQTALQALESAQRLFPESLTFTERASKRAGETRFRKGGVVFDVLVILALAAASSCDPRDLLRPCKGNGARSRSKDSAPTLEAFGAERTLITEDGDRIVCSAHITLGHGMKVGKTLQIYYRRLADGRFEITHCGDHLRTTSRNT